MIDLDRLIEVVLDEAMAKAVAIIVFGVAIFTLAFLLGLSATAEHLRAQAIERGYGLYCPTDGDWAWKGECDQ